MSIVKLKTPRNKIEFAFVGILVLLAAIFVVKSITKQNQEQYRFDDKGVEYATKEILPDFDKKSGILTSPQLNGDKVNNFGSFKFEIRLANDWRVDKSATIEKDLGYMLTLNKDNLYYIDINYSVAYGPSTCVYPGDLKPESGYESIDKYDIVKTELGVLRISRNDINLYAPNGVIFRVCQMSKYNEWTTSTKLGSITIRTPYKYDKDLLLEAEDIIRSLKIIR